MKSPESSILKLYASSTDKMGTQLLYEHIVNLAKDKGISGVTVYRGIMGYGSSSSHISTSRYWELTEKLPIMIEMIDKDNIIEDFYKLIETDLLKMSKGCLVTIEPVKIKLQKTGKKTK
jgi:PII-like signaling protein